MVIVSWLLAVVLALGVLPLALAWTGSHLWRLQDWPPAGGALVVGLVLGLLAIATRRPNWFAHTFLHESAHALACLVLWVRLHRFHVTAGQGGHVLPERTDPLRSFLILLAPYILPLVLGAVLLGRWLLSVDSWWQAAWQFLLGFAFMHHWQGLWHNLRLNSFGRNADLVRIGRPLAWTAVACAQVAWVGVVVLVAYR